MFMGFEYHRLVQPASNHGVIRWTPANAAALAAIVPVATDRFHQAFQEDTGELFILTNHSPVTWKQIATPLMQYVAVSSSRALAVGDYFRTLLVDSSGGARVITLPKTSTLAIPVGASGLIRRYGANDVSVAAEDGTVTVNSSGNELKVSRDKGQLYWELQAANTFFISGEKKA